MGRSKALAGILAIVCAIFLSASGEAAAQAGCQGEPRYEVISLSAELPVTQPGLILPVDYTVGFREKLDGHALRPETVLVRLPSGECGEVDRSLVKIYEDGRSDVLRADQLLHGSDPAATPLEAKVVVRNSEERHNRVRDNGESINAIAVRDRPAEAGSIVAEIKIFQIFSVHQRIQDGERDWWFVGRDRSGLDEGSIDNDLLGWVDADDLILWSQREAVYPRPVEGSVSVFEDSALTRAILELPVVDDGQRDRVIGKLPLLASRGSAQQVVVAADSTGEKAISPDQEVQRQRLRQLIEAGGNIDVLLVLDNTESMERYRDAVLKGLADAYTDSSESGRFRVATAVFGDYFQRDNETTAVAKEKAKSWYDLEPRREWPKSWQSWMGDRPFQFWLSDFGNSGSIPTIEEFQEEIGTRPYDDPRGDKPEAGLSALALAIREASWRSGEDATGFVFYVGDDADHDGEVQRAADLIAEKELIFLAINVAGRASGDTFNKQWIEQAEAVARASQAAAEKSVPVQKAYGDGGADVAATKDGVYAIASAAFDITGKTTTQLQDAAIGSDPERTASVVLEDSRRRLDELPIPMGRLLDQVIAQKVGSSEELSKFLEEAQTTVVGWVDAEPMQLHVTLTRSEYQALRSSVRLVCTNMADRDDFRYYFQELARNLAQSFLGEREEISLVLSREAAKATKIAEFFSRMTHLPVEYFSVFGDRSLDGFIDFLKEGAAEEVRAVRIEVCKSAELLDAIAEGLHLRRDKLEFLEWDDRLDEPTFQPASGFEVSKLDYYWGLENSISYYFVPAEFFPRAAEGATSTRASGGSADG